MSEAEEKKAKKGKKKAKKTEGKADSKAPTASKEEQKRLKEIAKALAYGVQQGFVDLERATRVSNAVTEAEMKIVINSLVSSEKLNATAQGRQAEDWAGGPNYLRAVDAVLLHKQLDREGTGAVDLQGFLNKIVGVVKVGKKDAAKTEKQKKQEEHEEFLKTVDWSSLDAVITTFPIHIQRQIEMARSKAVAKDVHIEEFDLRIPFSTKYLLDTAELRLPQRAKLALMGEPGSGKSVLFGAIANQEIKGFPNHLEVWHMKEIEVSPDAENLLDTVVHSHRFIMALRRAKIEITKAMETASGDKATALRSTLSYVETKLRETNADDAEEEAAKSLRVLGFDDAAQKKSVNSLSGGLRMRVALCSAFFVQADILLLDEPTNHLDFPSLLWLENRLRSYRNIFVMVCHDRDILNNVCNSVMCITEEKGLKYYDMGFAAYEATREKAEKKYAADVDKFLTKNRNLDFSSPLAAEAATKRKWLENYNRKLVMRAGQFTFPAPDQILPDNEQKDQTFTPETQGDINVIKVTDVRFSYDPVTLPFIFNTPISIDIKMSTRMGVMGPNGAGKSTFLKLITGRLQPVSGTITTNRHAKIAYFAQHHSAEMDLNTTPFEFMLSRFPDEKVGLLKEHLGKVGCSGELTNSRMVDLSQGMRSCVLFAAITFKCPSLLIMDEPTNFLDIETVDALISASNKYRGSLLLVSHSRLFLNRCAHMYLSIVPGQFLVFDNLKACEQATYTFIAEMESGTKVKIGAGALAKHGANAAAGGSSEKAADVPTSGIVL